jgi:predicted AAA+ superfamily ATPase
MVNQSEAHKEICFKLFSNLSKYVRLNTLAEDTGYNWRTIKNHIDMMSYSYEERNKVSDIQP